MFLNLVFVLVAVLLTVLLVVLVCLSFANNYYMFKSEAGTGSQMAFFFIQNGSTGALFSSSVSSQVVSDPEIGKSSYK